MKTRFAVSAVIFLLLIGFGTFAFGQAAGPDVSGDWLFDVSGINQGGSVLTFNGDGTFEGYGFVIEQGGQDGESISLSGTYAVDLKGKITGSYVMSDMDPESVDPPSQGAITGKVDKKGSKMSLTFENGPNAKGILLPEEPDMPLFWTATVSAKGAKAVFEEILIEQFTGEGEEFLPFRVYNISGEGVVTEKGNPETTTILLQGGFILNSKGVAYGDYEIYENGALPGESTLIEEGVFTGKISPTAKKPSFSFKLTSSEGDKAVIKGVVLD